MAHNKIPDFLDMLMSVVATTRPVSNESTSNKSHRRDI